MTTILVCSDGGLGLDTLGEDDADVVLVDELCRLPRRIESLVPPNESELILAIHRSAAHLGVIQQAARRLGFDPLGVGIIDLEAVAGKELGRSLRAAVARSSHFPGCSSDQVKLLAPDRTTRRGLLSLGIPTYVGAPRIDQGTCAAGEGCRICASACPSQALSWVSGSISHDMNACVACGICVTACPRGSVHNPTMAPAAIEAEIRAAVGDGAEAVGIRFRCRGSTVAAEAGWHQVEISCTGMLDIGWLLASLALGSSRVDAVACEDGGCRLRNDALLAATWRDFVVVLEALGIDLTAARPVAPAPTPLEAGEWLDHRSTGRMIDLLAPESNVVVGLDTVAIGSVTIDPAACTACRMCSRICPTGALVSTTSDGVRIDFDPRLCVACGQCVSVCPERGNGAIAMTRGFDLTEWSLGRREVRHDPTPLCEICGGPVAPSSMLAKIGAMLGEDGVATMALIANRCVDCRGH